MLRSEAMKGCNAQSKMMKKDKDAMYPMTETKVPMDNMGKDMKKPRKKGAK